MMTQLMERQPFREGALGEITIIIGGRNDLSLVVPLPAFS